jgi:hypothetical protein
MHEFQFKICPVCGHNVSDFNYERHIDIQHSPEAERLNAELKLVKEKPHRIRKRFFSTRINCSLCKSIVKRKHIKHHYREKHDVEEGILTDHGFRLECQSRIEKAKEIQAIKIAELKVAKEEATRKIKDFYNQPIVCDKCKSRVQRINIKKHYLKAHGIEVKILTYEHFRPKSESLREKAKEMNQARKNDNFYTNKAIAQYVAKNPNKDEIGKFGVPQDKYRHGSYGVYSMEYDGWRNERRKI